jgi:DNA polymerase-1
MEQEPNPPLAEQRLLLVDAGSIIYPAYHVMKDLTNSKGFPTGAIFGVTRILMKILKEFPSKYVAICFDSRGKNFRHDKFEAYKAHRPAMDEALVVQVPRIKEVIDAFGLPMAEQQGYEADDVIAALTAQAKAQGLDTVIVTGDKDLMQLVDENVWVARPGRDPAKDLRLMDVKGVEAYMGIAPSKIRDFLALTGDSVDNVPGVPGIGEKTALQLLKEFGTFENIWVNVDQVKANKLRENLRTYRDQALLSRELVQLRTEGVQARLSDCQMRSADQESLKRLLEEFEFRSILRDLGLAVGGVSPPSRPAIQTHLVLTEEQFQLVLEKLHSAPMISLDTETTSEDALRAELVGISCAIRAGEAYYIPVGHDYLGAPEQLPRNDVISRLKPILKNKPIIGQNLKYDAKVLQRYGIELEQMAFDTMLAAYLIDPESRKDLDELAKRYLGHGVMHFKELGRERMNEVEVDRAAEYSCLDAEVVVRLREKLLPLLHERHLEKLYSEIELPLIDVLVEMERNGILIDKDVLREQAKELEVLLRQLQQEIVHLAGEEFNPNSPKQVAHILFEKLKLPVQKRTKTGPSTDASVLQDLAELHPLPEKLLASRELEKLLNTYIYKLPEYIHPQTGRVHTNFNQGVATTGRLSASDPNLQNIPIRTELGGQIRRAFIAPPGKLLIGADYSQIELRVLAHISQDPGLMAAFERDEDVHARTAATIFNLPFDHVGPRERRIAKTINFGLSYGMTSFGLAQRVGLSRSEADLFVKNYFSNYPGVKNYMEQVVREAESKGFLETLLGRRRYFIDVKGRAEREAINFPIQGTAADLMKLAMLQVHREVRSAKIRARLLLQVHDELIFEADAQDAHGAAEQIKHTMERIYALRVPLKADVHVGRHWGEI